MAHDPTPGRILCGVAAVARDDGSLSLGAGDRQVAEQAIALAGRVHATVRLMHAVDWLDRRRDGPDIPAIVERELQGDFDALRSTAEAAGVSLDVELRRGKPWRELLAAAREWRTDLLAISPRREGVSLVGRVLHGSTTARILKDSPCPVWVVRGGRAVRRILALIDRSDMSPAVVETARMLGRVFGAQLHALCCLEYPADIALQRLPAAVDEIQRYHRQERSQAWDDLEKVTGGEPEWTLTLGEDWVVRQAPKLVADRRIDLVVLAGASKPGLAGALGTAAQKLLERVEASVWVIRP